MPEQATCDMGSCKMMLSLDALAVLLFAGRSEKISAASIVARRTYQLCISGSYVRTMNFMRQV